MMHSGIAYQLQPLARLTDGIAFGLLPTPMARAQSDCPSERRRKNPCLESIVKTFPTPTTRDATVTKARPPEKMIRKDGRNVLRTPSLAETLLQEKDFPYTKQDLQNKQQGQSYKIAKQFWPTPTAQGRWASEGQITTLRKKVDAGELTLKEAEAMIEGSITPPRMKKWPTPTARDYKDTGDLKKLAKYSHKKRLACSVAAEELSNGDLSQNPSQDLKKED